MKTKGVFYCLLSFFLLLQLLIVFFLSKNSHFVLKIINYDSKIHRYIIFPKTISFKPNSTNDLIVKFQNTHYNFIFYLEWDFFMIEENELLLKLKV